MVYNYFRYYDPSTGRYVTSDPKGLKGGPNTYVYVENNPLKWIDPYGLSPAIIEFLLRPPPVVAPSSPVPDAGVGEGSGYSSGGRDSSRIVVRDSNRDVTRESRFSNYQCNADTEKEKNCRALYDTIIRSCWSIQDPRKRQRCFEAAKATYEFCMAED